MSGSLLEMHNICKVYRQGDYIIDALCDVDLCIDNGEFVSITGQSGSGKSTLMNILGCLDVPTSGTYLIDGNNVGEMSSNEISELRSKKIGFIFQNFCLIPDLDALENVELPLRYQGISKERRKEIAMQSLEKVGLSHRLYHRPSQMSGGQQQRVAIARAIAASPSVILADEPTGNLDSKSGESVMEILRELNCDGKTIILITHDDKIAKKAKRHLDIRNGIVT